jgi:hypothetical protein
MVHRRYASYRLTCPPPTLLPAACGCWICIETSSLCATFTAQSFCSQNYSPIELGSYLGAEVFLLDVWA